MLDTGLYAEGKEAVPGTQNVGACCLVTRGVRPIMAAYRAEFLCHLIFMQFNGRNISEDAPKRFGADLTFHVTQQSQDEIRRRA